MAPYEIKATTVSNSVAFFTLLYKVISNFDLETAVDG